MIGCDGLRRLNPTPMTYSFQRHLEWRFATKDFDPEKPLSEENLNAILEAIQMSPSSYGLQPYHVYVVTDAATKTKLREAGYGQAQFEDAQAILVFASRTDIMDRIDSYLELASGGNPEIKEKMTSYADMMRQSLGNLNEEQRKAWADRQAYIALGFAMAAAAEHEVDSCPMEGFVPSQFNDILDLPEHMHSVVVLALGYRTEDPSRPKVRYQESDLFTHV